MPTSSEIAAAKARVHNHPGSGDAHFGLARLYIAAGRVPEGIQELQLAVDRSPKLEIALRALARFYGAVHRLDLESEMLQRQADIPSRDYRPSLRLAQIDMQLQWLSEAQLRMRRALQLAPNRPEVQYEAARLRFLHGDTNGAVQALQAALQRMPEDASLAYLLARYLLVQGRMSEAETLLRSTLRRSPEERRAHLLLVYLLLHAGARPRAQEALEELCQVQTLAPPDAEFYHRQAKALLALGRTPEALAAFRDAIRIEPGFEDSLLQLGRLLIAQGRPEEGRRQIALYERGKQNAAAYQHAREEVQNHPDMAAAHCRLAVWHLRLAEPTLAILEYRRALQLQPDSAEAKRGLQQTLHRIGRGGTELQRPLDPSRSSEGSATQGSDAMTSK